jgi:hypothetical protein
MCRFNRAVRIAAAMTLGLALAGCGSVDPMSWFNKEKKLPGQREPVFPGGVPGVSQGVPKDLYKGNQPPATADLQTTPAANPAVQSAPAPQVAATAPEPPPQKPKPRPKKKVVHAKPKPKPQPAPAPAAAAPWPAQNQQPAQQAQPAQSAQSPWPGTNSQQNQTAPTVWPDPPAAGTFSR